MGVLVRNKINYSGSGDILIPTNYSLEEQRIGTWIDGKPLYQKTVVFEPVVTISNTQWTLLPNTQDLYNIIDSLVLSFGHCDSSRGMTVTRSFEASIDETVSTNGIIALSLRNGVDYIKATTLQYTKTTD